MKTHLVFGIVAFVLSPFAQAIAAPTLKCTVIDRRCDNSGTTIQEKYEIRAEMISGRYSVEGRTTTNDKRFVISGIGMIESKGAKRPKSMITIYDSQTKTGAAAGKMSLGSSASPRSNIVFVYDTSSIDDTKDLFCHSLEGFCLLK